MNREISLLESFCFRACAAALVLSAVTPVLHAQVLPFAGPAESLDVKNQMPPLMQAVQSANWVDTATRIDAIVHDSPDALISTDNGNLVSLRTWIDSLPVATRVSIVPEYDKLNGEAAKQALETVITKPGARPEDFVGVATAYPLDTVAGEAWGRAALRAVDFGDVSIVPVLLKRATDHGWSPTDAQKAVLDAAANLVVPTSATVPIVTPWYAVTPPPAARHVVPVAAGGSIFTASERGVVATKDVGELLWQFVAPKADSVMSGARNGFHRPAVLCDPAGKPQVVIARQIVGGTRFGCLRAFRASDGKPLWSSESSAALGSYSMVSAPVIAGGTTLVIGVDDTARPAPVALFAFETMTGQLLWQTPLGAFNNLTEEREAGSLKEVNGLWANSGVAVDGPDIFVNLNAGLIACVDRVDGKIRWTHSYTSIMTSGDQLLALARRAQRNEPGTHDLYKTQMVALRALLGKTQLDVPADDKRDKRDVDPNVLALAAYFSRPPRWFSTPAPAGDVLVIAGADMTSAAGLDRHTGVQLWEVPDDLRNATLLGVSGDSAIFATAELSALDIHSAKVSWSWTSPTSDPIQGPPSLVGKTIRANTGKVTYSILADTGKGEPQTGVNVAMTASMNNEASRNALLNIDALPSLALPPAPPPEPKDTKKPGNDTKKPQPDKKK